MCLGCSELLRAESCCGMCSISRERVKQPRARLVCRAKQAVEQKEPHLAPISGGEKLVPISSRAISHRGYSLGKQGTELCVPREGGICAAMALTCLLGSRFDLGSSQVTIRQKKKSTLSGSFLLLCGVFLFLILQFWFLGVFGCLISSQSSVALTLWEFFFHGHAF